MATKSGLDKNNKYDRQLRLWGDHGQSALEGARVCLVNATATGTETLKNLILPGIGAFTIVDGYKVQGEDIGNNFFLSKDSLGESRAKTCTELLSELNEDVSGDYVDEHPENLMESNPNFFSKFSIVIATNLCERTLLKLSGLLWEQNIPLLVCRCYGFIGYMRLVIPEHTVIESHPDSYHEDLRLDRPFPALEAFCNALDLNTMTTKEHSHTPWLVLIYKYLHQWQDMHGGNSPKTYKEKSQLKELIKTGIRKTEEGALEIEENFDEAVKHVNSALHPSEIPNEVKQLFNDPSCINISSESKPFWILLRAIKDYTENEGKGLLPLRGTIPDMTSDSDRYIQLQNVYRNQAFVDACLVIQKVNNLLQSIHKDKEQTSTYPAETNNEGTIPENTIRSFCRNAAFLRVVRCRSLQQEYDASTARCQEIESHIADADTDDELVFYVMLRAVDKFFEQYNRYPGVYDDQVEADIPRLKSALNKVLQDWGLAHTIRDDYVHEICRYGAAELHTVASFIGGAAAQEVIKTITTQFVPFNNTLIYNAMKQTTLTVEL